MAHRPQEDLFEGTKMTFGEHIEELRGALFKAIIGLAIGVAIGFYMASTVVSWIQTPLKAALEEYYLEEAIEELAAERDIDPAEMPLEVVTIVRERRLAPSTMMVDPENLLAAIQDSEPDATEGARFQPHRLSANDVNDDKLKDFLARWSREGQSAGASAAGRLWQMLPAERQQQLVELTRKEQLTAEDHRAVVQALNSLIDRPSTHRAQELQAVEAQDRWLGAALESLRAKQANNTLTPSESRRLNRLLLTAVFPEYVAYPGVRLIDLPFWRPINIKVQSLGAEEAFMIWLKAAFITGLLVAMPWIFWKLWEFVGAGLYPHEKKYVYLYLPISIGLFFAGCALAFFFVFQPVLSFLFSFNRAMNIDPDPRISEWLSFVLFLPLGFGISFQLPLVMLFLNRIGIFTVETYISKWRIAILTIFVISMILTPADPISMMLMACPLSVLYFGGVAMCRWMPANRNPYAELQVYEP